jgi:hypothetical protein
MPARGGPPRVITWTTENLTRPGAGPATENIRAVSDQQIRGIELSLAEIERVTNVRFVRVSGAEAANAQIRYMQGHTADGSSFASSTGDQRYVVLDDRLRGFEFGETGYGFVIHESLHTLGMCHPGCNGRHPLYNGESTTMHYADPAVVGLGAYDIAALRFLYGDSSNPHNPQYAFNDLRNTTVLHSPGAASIIMGGADRGELTVNLANADQFFGRRITGNVNGRRISAGIAPGTTVNNVQFAGSQVQLNITTAAGVEASGGSASDTFNIVGGNNLLTGNGGADVFKFSQTSGTGNVITDYNPNEDRIEFTGLENATVELTQRENYAFGGGNRSGTEMVIKRGGVVVSTAFLEGADADTVGRKLQTTVRGPVSNSISVNGVLLPPNPNQPMPSAPTQSPQGASGMWALGGAAIVGILGALLGGSAGGIVPMLIGGMLGALVGGFGGNMLGRNMAANANPLSLAAGENSKPAPGVNEQQQSFNLDPNAVRDFVSSLMNPTSQNVNPANLSNLTTVLSNLSRGIQTSGPGPGTNS